HVRVGEVDGTVMSDGNVVRAVESLALVSGREHGARAVLLQAHEGAILACAPDHAALPVDTGAVGSHQGHVDARDVRELSDVGEVSSGVSGFIEEYRYVALGGHLVNDVAEDAHRQQITRGAV